MNNNELATINTTEISAPSGVENLINAESSFFCSIHDDGTRESKVKIFNAINKSENKLDDHKGEVINVVDVAAHSVSIVDENTGELVECTRVVLITDKGVGYEAISQGVISSLTKIFAIVGKPSYNPPLKMKIVEQKTRKGFKTNTIELV